MRRTLIIDPGAEGIIRDIPRHLLPANAAYDCTDALRQAGRLRSRWGISKQHVNALSAASAGQSVARAQFALSGNTVDLVVRNGGVFVDLTNALTVATFSGYWLPRALYNDEMIFCDQSYDPQGIVRYAGCSGTAARTAGHMTVLTEDRYDFRVYDVVADAYVSAYAYAPGAFLKYFGNWAKILEGAGDNTTMDRPSGETLVPPAPEDWIYDTAEIYRYGRAWPGVVVYEKGTSTKTSGSTVTGLGTGWTGQGWGEVREDGIAGGHGDGFVHIPSSGNAMATFVGTVTDADTLSHATAPAFPANWTNQRYQITRRLPWKDVCVYRESLVGTGCEQFPNRVWVAPPGWSMNGPPGFVEPVKMEWSYESSNPDDFTLYYLDVPTPHAGDPNVAILASPNGINVLKRREHHLITGSFPNFSQRLVNSGVGCIDIRSAQSFKFGRVWGGEDGFYVEEDSGRVRDLTEGRINSLWRSITAIGDYGPTNADVCAAGEVGGVLFVGISTDGGADYHLFTYDLEEGVWASRWTNHASRFFFTSKLDGEAERLLSITDDNAADDERHVWDLGPAVLGGAARTAQNGEFSITTGSGMAQAAGMEGEATVADVAVHAGARSATAETNVAALKVDLTHANGVRQTAAETKRLGTVAADLEAVTSDVTVRRNDMRANRSGRLITLEISTTQEGLEDKNPLDVEIAEVVFDLIDSPAGT